VKTKSLWGEKRKLELQKSEREIETAVQVCAPTARTKIINLNFHVPQDISKFESDAVRFRQVVINLIHNAIKPHPRLPGTSP